MQVTTEDGGRLNAFAKEPRMEVMDLDTPQPRSQLTSDDGRWCCARGWLDGGDRCHQLNCSPRKSL